MNATDKKGNTPLHCVRDSTVAESLLDNAADVHHTNDDGDTPLHLAAWHGELDIAKLLIQKEAAVDRRNNFGETPLFLANVWQKFATKVVGKKFHTIPTDHKR